MANKIIVLIVILGIIILISGCIGTQEKKEVKEEVKDNKTTKTETEMLSPKEEATAKCINECRSRKDTEDLTSGPCLSNEITPDWVCDVAHKPRQDVDNKPENQCSAFREGKAHHFVELDLNCSLIKFY